MKITNHINTILTLLFLVSCSVKSIGQLYNAEGVHVLPETVVSIEEIFQNYSSGSLIMDGELYLRGDFINDGVVDYTLKSYGLTRFIGTSIQVLSGTNTSYFNDVLFENYSDNFGSFELASVISIGNQANFLNGIIQSQTEDALVVFDIDGSHINVSNASHVDGFVQKIGDSNFKFPIGDARYFRFASLNSQTSLEETYNARYWFENPTVNYPLENKVEEIEIINDQEYWVIENRQDTQEILITLSWDEMTTTPLEIVEGDLSNLVVVWWNNLSNQWENAGGVVNENAKTITAALTIENSQAVTLGRIMANEESETFDIYNGVTPNGDGLNDFFEINSVQNYPNNTLKIFNRWGVLVWETDGYGGLSGEENVFRGESNGRATIASGEQLPTGTYFYVLTFNGDQNPGKSNYTGFLYINR